MRLPARDPRTVARDIPGLLDTLFPELTPGVVIHLNRTAKSSPSCDAIEDDVLNASTLPSAMLFELAYAAGEQLLNEEKIDWEKAAAIATARQQRHFDAKPPQRISKSDIYAAERVANNLATIVTEMAGDAPVLTSPRIPGYQWIASGVGDISIENKLLEVKCSSRRFGSSDYRQVLMYWLLSYAASIENEETEWGACILINPRLNLIVEFAFNDLVLAVSAGRTKVELLELFAWLVGDRSGRTVSHV
jgi:hypothetical protein